MCFVLKTEYVIIWRLCVCVCVHVCSDSTSEWGSWWCRISEPTWWRSGSAFLMSLHSFALKICHAFWHIQYCKEEGGWRKEGVRSYATDLRSDWWKLQWLYIWYGWTGHLALWWLNFFSQSFLTMKYAVTWNTILVTFTVNLLVAGELSLVKSCYIKKGGNRTLLDGKLLLEELSRLWFGLTRESLVQSVWCDHHEICAVHRCHAVL